MDVIDSSALCLAKFPAPMKMSYSLGSQALSLPSEREENLQFYLGTWTPAACPFCPSLPLACFTYPAPLPTCQVSLGNSAEAGVPTGLGQAGPLVPAAASWQWALLGLC